MIALVSTPCLTPGVMPSGIAVLKQYLTDTGAAAKCYFLANEFELQIVDEHPRLFELYTMTAEIGYDYQNPFFSALIFNHLKPESSVTEAIRRTFSGRAGLPPLFDNEEFSDADMSLIIERESRSALRFCRILKEFCEESIQRILADSPALVGFSCFSSQLFPALYMAKQIKKQRPSMPIGFGGGLFLEWNVGTYARLLPYVDCFIGGRDLKSISKLLNRLKKGPPESNVAITSYHSSEAVCPDFSDGRAVLAHPNRPAVSIPISNSHGCAWARCAFCPAPTAIKKQAWDPQTLAGNLLQTAATEGIASFNFAEWEINSSPQTLLSFCKYLSAKGLTMLFWGEFTPWLCSRELFSAMSACGQWHLQMGIESFSNDLLKLMTKRQGVVENVKALRLALEEGIAGVIFNLIYGFPGTTAAHIRESIAVASKIPHLLSDPRVTLELVPFDNFRPPYSQGRGIRAETEYLPRSLIDSFPTQLAPQKTSRRLLPLWQELRRKITRSSVPYCLAFDTGHSLVIEDIRQAPCSLTLTGLDADIMRCILDDVASLTDLSARLGAPRREASNSLERLIKMDLAIRSDDRYIALPMRV